MLKALWGDSTLDLDLPAFSKGGFYPFVRIGVVRHFPFGGVVQQLAFTMNRDGAKHQPFGVLTSDAEVRARRGSPFACPNPIAAMGCMVITGAGAGGTWQVGPGQFVLGPARAR